MEKEITYVSGLEQEQIARALLNWLNRYREFPDLVKKIEMEYLSRNTSMGLFAVTAAYKTREYISGAYEAQYQFALQYRTAPANSNQRLNAIEALGSLAAWAERQEDLPDLGAGKRALSIERNSPPIMVDRHEDGNEDYQILMAMDYEVRPNANLTKLTKG